MKCYNCHNTEGIVIQYENRYCNDCFDYLFSNCDKCGEITRNDDIREFENGVFYCRDCITEFEEMIEE